MFWTPSSWRVGLVFVLYGVFFLASRDITPLWVALYLVPLYFFIEPISEPMAKSHVKNRQNGFIPYGITLMGVGMVVVLGLVYIYAYLHNLPFGETALGLLSSGLAFVPVFLTVLASWLVRERAYKHYLPLWEKEEKAARKAARKGKKKTKA